MTWQRDPTSTMTVQWVGVESDGLQRPVWYAKKGSEEWRQQENTKRSFPMTDRWIFRTELTALEPDTDYVFRVGLDSEELRFRTMPAKPTNAIQFVSGGDSGIGPHARQSNFLAAKQAPMFVVMGGDIAYDNAKNPEVFFQYLDNYSLDLRDSDRRLVPLLACFGNHDVDGSYDQTREKAPFFYSFFDGLFTDTGYACLDIGQYMSLILLDSGHTSPIGGDQAAWLEKTPERASGLSTCIRVQSRAFPTRLIGSFLIQIKGQAQDPKAVNIGCRCLSVLTSTRCSSITTIPTNELGRCSMAARTKKACFIWGMAPGAVFANQSLPIRGLTWAVTDENYHLSVHRIEGPQQFHVAISDEGKVVDVCMTSKRGGTRRG